jgi:hypothetical protein
MHSNAAVAAALFLYSTLSYQEQIKLPGGLGMHSNAAVAAALFLYI